MVPIGDSRTSDIIVYMANILIRDVPDEQLATLRSLAGDAGVSVVEFLRQLLTERLATKRRFGLLKGIVALPPDDFFAPLSDEELADWYGE